MDNNLVTALVQAVRALTPYAESERDSLADRADDGCEDSAEELVAADKAIRYANATAEVAEATAKPAKQILDRMHGIDFPTWVYFSPQRALNGIPCYWSEVGEWVPLTQASLLSSTVGIQIPFDGAWIPYKTVSEKSCFRALGRPRDGGPMQDHFIWSKSAKEARAELAKALGPNYTVTILSAIA